MKLHLGCGQVYLNGYLNIDYPLSKHSVQHESVADKFADITKLCYQRNSIEEVRLHHVFEHFDRATASALILIWRSWMKPGGLLRIEVPDFERTIKVMFSPLTTDKRKLVGFRHIFGSQEASWAVHYHGWSKVTLSALMQKLGFEILSVSKNNWKGTYNIEIVGKKNNLKISKKQAGELCRQWLENFIVDESAGERDMLSHWVKISKNQIGIGWAK